MAKPKKTFRVVVFFFGGGGAVPAESVMSCEGWRSTMLFLMTVYDMSLIYTSTFGFF